MKKLHALGTGLVGVALSATAVLAAAPASPSEGTSTIPTPASAPEDARTPHGAAVSAVAKDETQVGGDHANHGGAVSLVAKQKTDPASDLAPEPAADPDTQTHPDNHGAVVSAVAKDKTKVGGKHGNHGGAVSEAAHQAHAPNGQAPGHSGGHD